MCGEERGQKALIIFTNYIVYNVNKFTVKSGVLFPPILQHSRQYCNVHALIAPSKLHRNLQVAAMSISTNLLISIFSRHIFVDKNTGKQLILFGSIFISENLPGNQQIC